MKKSLFLIGSILGAAALIGGTFAAWAVTDKADPFSVNITPGTLDVGTNKAVTLEWGTRGLVNIENIEMGKTRGPYVLGLVARTSNNGEFVGNLSVKLTTTSAATDKLLNHLTVKVYNGETKEIEQNQTSSEVTSEVTSEATSEAQVTEKTPILTIASGTSTSKEVNVDLTVNSGEERTVCFYVTLDSGLTPLQYNELKTQNVTMTVDWNKGSEIEEVSSRTVYFNVPTSWNLTTVKAYAWDSETGKSNADWPGIAMSAYDAVNRIYSIDVETEFNKIIFTDAANKDTQNPNQTGNLDIPTDNDAMYYNNGWTKNPAAPTTEVSYYLVGGMSDWITNDTYKLTEEAGTKGTFSYTHVLRSFQTSGVEVKVAGNNNVWYGESSNEQGAGNVALGAGVYDVYFNPSKSGDVYILFDYLPVTAKKNGEAFAIIDSATDEDHNNNFAKVTVTLAANDYIEFFMGNVQLDFYSGETHNDGNKYTATAEETRTFWVNKQFQVW